MASGTKVSENNVIGGAFRLEKNISFSKVYVCLLHPFCILGPRCSTAERSLDTLNTNTGFLKKKTRKLLNACSVMPESGV